LVYIEPVFKRSTTDAIAENRCAFVASGKKQNDSKSEKSSAEISLLKMIAPNCGGM